MALRRFFAAMLMLVLLGSAVTGAVDAAQTRDPASAGMSAAAVRSFRPWGTPRLNQTCTRSYALTLLWRFAGSPEGKPISEFYDLTAADPVYPAVCWAAAANLLEEDASGCFVPEAPIPRGEFLTMLWRYAGKPAPTTACPFTDVTGNTELGKAACWANETGVLSRTGSALHAEHACTRGELVLLLWRFKKLQRQPKLCVVLDPGHQTRGNYDKEPLGPGSTELKAKTSSGTYGPTSGLYEYELNLTVSLLLREELERRGYRVVMTRTTHDVTLSNIERAEIANNAHGDAMIRIHANGSDNTERHGAETVCMTRQNPYHPELYARCRSLSDAIVNHMCRETGAKNNGVWETDTMTGINWSRIPVTIVEMGYMSNPTEDRNMAGAAYQAKLVRGIADGIDEYFGRTTGG